MGVLVLAAPQPAELDRLIWVDEHHPVASLRQELDEGQVVVAGRLQADQDVAELRGEPLLERPESLEAGTADRAGDPTEDAISHSIVAGRLMADLADIDGDSRQPLTPTSDVGDAQGRRSPTAKHDASSGHIARAPDSHGSILRRRCHWQPVGCAPSPRGPSPHGTSLRSAASDRWRIASLRSRG